MSDLDDLFGKGGLQGILGARPETSETADAPPEIVDGPASAVARSLDLLEQAAPAGANAPITPAGGNRVWLVLAGGLDIFFLADARPQPSGKLQGRRQHIARVEAGHAAFGFAEELAEKLLIVPTNRSLLVETTLEALGSRSRDTDTLPHVVRLFNKWLESVVHTVTPGAPPSQAIPLKAGASGEAAQDGDLQASRDPVWIRVVADSFSFCGEAEDPEAPADSSRFLPLTRVSWVHCKRALPYKALATTLWLSQGDLDKDLDGYHRLVMALVTARAEHHSRIDASRFDDSRRYRRNVFRSALESLASVITQQRYLLRDRDPDPLIGAAQIVAQTTGFELVLNSDVSTTLRQSADRVEALARAGGFFARAITLESDWWRDNQGPILGFFGDDQKPCALVPDASGDYDLVDPGGEVRAVSPKLASEIAAGAYTFYAPFPTAKPRPAQLFMFGLRGTRRDVVTVATMILLTGLLSLATPIVTGWVMDPIIPEAQMGQLATMITALLISGLSMAVFGLVQSFAVLRLEGRMTNVVQAAVWDRLLKLPASFFRRFTVGDLVNRAQSIDQIRQLISSATVRSILHGVIGLFSLALMTYYDWHLSLATAVVVAIYGVITYLIGRKIVSRARTVLTLTGRIQGIVLQLLNAVSKLRVNGAERQAFAQWAQPYAELQMVSFSQRNLNNALVVFRSAFNYFAVFGIVFVIGWQGKELLAFYHTPTNWSEITGTSLQKIMPTARFVAFHVAFGQFLSAAFGLTQVLIELASVKPLYERVEPILSAEEESDEGSEDPGEVFGEIQVHNVHFRYRPDLPLVLRGLTFEARPGQFVAVAGPSGAGKSSIIRLILGFEQAESGSVFLDGKDVKGLDKRAMRRNFGVVLQNGRVLSGSIFHNITAGANLTRDDAWEAARLAGLDKDIEAMPMGMDTYLGEGATTISGGQRQRLMIARAVIRRPRVIIFDEATSALDNETQAIVNEGLKTVNSTRIVIAHRLSSIVDADIIYAIDEGRVVEAGTYRELMAKNGFFASLARRQLA